MSYRSAVALVALLTMTAGCATAPAVPPTWARTPDPQALADAYPGFAEDAGIEGAAEIECRVSEARLEACEVKSEKPAGLGFGAAALSLSGQYLVQADSRGELPRSVSFMARFALPPAEPPAPWQGPEPAAEALAVARTIAGRLDLSLNRGANAARLDGVSADRRPAVEAMIAAVEAETGAAVREGFALHLARTQSVENLRLLTSGQRRPGRPAMTDDEIERSRDRLALATQLQNERLKAVYCARYRC